MAGRVAIRVPSYSQGLGYASYRASAPFVEAGGFVALLYRPLSTATHFIITEALSRDIAEIHSGKPSST